MPSPGFYKTNYRALRVRELLRWGSLLRLPLAYLATRFMRPGNAIWMPGLWADNECKRGDLSDRFWQSTLAYRQEFERLGFAECGVSKITRHLNPNYRDNGGITYLDQSRCHVGFLLYTKIHVAPPIAVDQEQIVCAFSVAFERGSLNYTNNTPAFDPLPHDKVVRLPSADPSPMYQRLLQELSRSVEPPRHFPDLESLRSWFDEAQMRKFQDLVQSGLFVRMNDEEVEAARRKFPPPLQQ